MELNGLPSLKDMTPVKLTPEQIAASKEAAAKFKEKVASGEITIKYPDKPLEPGVIYHPSRPTETEPSIGVTPDTPVVDTPLTYTPNGTVVLTKQG
ncbi:hypothetical protein NYP20_09165 [Pseudomonas sp. N3-W]|uniref:Uncharacterized protein n=1 Tax=Pseudomonas fungipugnans TaxID=3024217 RepID=A0ABT6QVC6_9PSED|nr:MULTISPECIES: hypothetical protein [unclassified Pseudomonas]MDI2594763.1 hypothetical protein [Pseudomonas sp. 681]UWF51111.1 hypothetical protein NYP20_09165 [Pseudomonas sp. N3-W]